MRELQALVTPRKTLGALVGGHAGRVIIKLSVAAHREPSALEDLLRKRPLRSFSKAFKDFRQRVTQRLKGEVTWGFYGRTSFIIRIFLASSGRSDHQFRYDHQQKRQRGPTACSRITRFEYILHVY